MWTKELIKESWNVLLLKIAPSCGLTDCLVFGMISPWQRKVRRSSISLGTNALIFSFPIGPGAVRKRRVDGQHPPYLLLSKRQERQNLPNHLDRQKQSDWQRYTRGLVVDTRRNPVSIFDLCQFSSLLLTIEITVS